MAENMKANTETTKNMVTEYSLGPMDVSMMVNGPTVSKKEWEFTTTPRAKKDTAFGRMERE